MKCWIHESETILRTYLLLHFFWLLCCWSYWKWVMTDQMGNGVLQILAILGLLQQWFFRFGMRTWPFLVPCRSCTDPCYTERPTKLLKHRKNNYIMYSYLCAVEYALLFAFRVTKVAMSKGSMGKSLKQKLTSWTRWWSCITLGQFIWGWLAFECFSSSGLGTAIFPHDKKCEGSKWNENKVLLAEGMIKLCWHSKKWVWRKEITRLRSKMSWAYKTRKKKMEVDVELVIPEVPDSWVMCHNKTLAVNFTDLLGV